MKFLPALAVAALGAIANSVHAAVELEAPKPLVLIVHGRGHVDADSATLRRAWKRLLDTSLARAGQRPLPEADVRVAWYADVLDPAASGCSRSVADDMGLDIFAGILTALVESLPAGEGREARSLVGDLLYVMDDAKRCAAKRRVGQEIERSLGENRPVIIVAYSLGSVIAYDYLRARVTTPREPELHLITLGSPLGVRELRELLGVTGDSLRPLSSIRSWQNVYDPSDPFSAPISARDAQSLVIDRATTEPSESDPHPIGRYLADGATGQALARLLNPGTTVRP